MRKPLKTKTNRGKKLLRNKRNVADEPNRHNKHGMPVTIARLARPISQINRSRNQKDNLEENLKSTRTLLFVLALFGAVAMAQSAPPARTDVYHVHFAKAALGKAVELADFHVS